MFVCLFQACGKIIAFLISFGLSAVFLFAGITVIIIAGIVSANPVIDHQAIFSIIPSWLPVLALGCGLSGVTLAIMLGARAIRKNFGTIWLTVICFLILGMGVFGSVQTGTRIAEKLQNVYESGTTNSFSINSGALVTINMDSIRQDFRGDSSFRFRMSHPSVELIPSDDDSIHVKNTISIRTVAPEQATQILATVSPLASRLDNGNLSLSISDKSDFKNTVPLTFLDRHIQISLPKNIRAKITGNSRHLFGSLPQTSQAMQDHGIYECNDLERFYDQKTNTFICQSDAAIQDAIKHEREAFIRDQNADFFAKDADGWVRVKSIDETGTGSFIVTWRDDDKKNVRKLQVTFGDGYDEDHLPIVTKKEDLK